MSAGEDGREVGSTVPRGGRAWVGPLLAVATPAAIFVAHALVLQDWIIDDAGISFAYARNLAAGYGLVAQPHTPPVEGYSNFLWVLTLAPFFAIGVFGVVWTPKILAVLLTIGLFVSLHRALSRLGAPGPWAGLLASSLVALQTAFVVWAVSGLENALYALVLGGLLARTMGVMTIDTAPGRAGISLGLLAVAAALTRPDGVVYAVAFPMLVGERLVLERSGARRAWLPPLGWYTATFLALAGAFLAVRWWYFGDILPNTYYAKGGVRSGDLAAALLLKSSAVLRLLYLMQGVAGPAATLLLTAVFSGTLALLFTRRFQVVHLVLLTFLALSTLTYLILPLDWMSEYRFATPFFVLFYAYLVALVWSIGDLIGAAAGARRHVFAVVGGLLALATLGVSAPRTVAFARNPPVPLAAVAEIFGRRLNRVAASLGLDSGSILLSDVGGTLLYSRLRVYDLAGLCDRTIARTLGRGRDEEAFFHYVFLETRPVFIHLANQRWSDVANFAKAERFGRDYVLLAEHVDEATRARLGLAAYPGRLFVRRDALTPRETGVLEGAEPLRMSQVLGGRAEERAAPTGRRPSEGRERRRRPEAYAAYVEGRRRPRTTRCDTHRPSPLLRVERGPARGRSGLGGVVGVTPSPRAATR